MSQFRGVWGFTVVILNLKWNFTYKWNFRDFEKVKLFSLMWNLKGKVPTLVKNRPEAENFENFSH